MTEELRILVEQAKKRIEDKGKYALTYVEDSQGNGAIVETTPNAFDDEIWSACYDLADRLCRALLKNDVENSVGGKYSKAMEILFGCDALSEIASDLRDKVLEDWIKPKEEDVYDEF